MNQPAALGLHPHTQKALPFPGSMDLCQCGVEDQHVFRRAENMITREYGEMPQLTSKQGNLFEYQHEIS